jgi:DTW domain-containing protein YfiP
MARSVVFNHTPRCELCRLQPRWCVCEAHRPVESALKVDILMHHMEAWRPSSTGHLIKRVVADTGLHVFRAERPLVREEIVQPGRELWILHPTGDDLPAGQPPAGVQVLLLDGTWIQSTAMLRVVEPWGRRVSLPMTGESRYWLRSQASDDRFSTIEALLFLMSALGMKDEHERLQLQFELHVYAGLCARGKKAEAAEYLLASPVREVLKNLIPTLKPWAQPSRRERDAVERRRRWALGDGPAHEA